MWIQGYRWEIRYEHALLDEDGDPLLGASEVLHHRISINLDQCRDRMVNTLVHEALHGYVRDEPGFSDSTASTDFPAGDRLEEAVMVMSVKGLRELLRLNPWVRALVFPA
jgi:hypothetical protein